MNFLIIDATNLLYRTWHVTQRAPADILILTYLRSIRKYLNEFKPDVCYSVSDKRLVHGIKNYRRQDEDYKQNRDKSLWQYVHESEDTIQELTTHLGIINMFPGILEADDVISFLCGALNGKKTIVSTDNDMAQLIGKDVQLYSPVKKILVTLDNFEQYYPVSKSRFLLYKSIIGDAADNIKGLAGYGKVKAKKLTEQFEQNVNTLSAEQKAHIKYNLELVDLSHGLKMHPEELKIYEDQLQSNKSVPNFKAFLNMSQQLQLNSIVSDAESWQNLLPS